MKPVISIQCGEYELRTMVPTDITDSFVDWFNSKYVIDGLNLGKRKFSRQDHVAHIFAVGRNASELLVARERCGRVVNSYFKFDIDAKRSIGTVTLAVDRNYDEKAVLIRNCMWHATRFFFNTRRVVKLKFLMNARNVAARSYIPGTEFRHEGTLRSEAVYRNGERDDVLVYSVLQEDLADRWGKVSPYSPQQSR